MLLKRLFSGKIVFAGVGNVLKADDGFGPVLASEIMGRVSFKVFDAGMAPENYLGALVKEKPDTLIIADTADMGKEEGSSALLRPDALSDSSFFLTHNSSLQLLLEFISAEGVSAEVFVLCAQPGTLALGGDLSPGVMNEIRRISSWFIDNFPVL